VNNSGLAALLSELNSAKAHVKRVKDKLVPVAVETLGISQEEAVKNYNLEYLLEGYLIGQGVDKSLWRRVEKSR
jgi:hypothetical protein